MQDVAVTLGEAPAPYTAFAGSRRLASGALAEVALHAKEALDRGVAAPVLIFDNRTSQVVEVDFRGQPSDVLRRLETPRRRPGRPRLGVVAREVTLLPHHWEWLRQQPGGASVALRKLVEEASGGQAAPDRRRLALEACYRFLRIMAGDLPGFEEASRALYAGKRARFEALAGAWPEDLGPHACRLAAAAFESRPEDEPPGIRCRG
ncbi:DUF2239 family protein [Roseomonas marmotae]|uniref:DUF2239 family protein n=1 Tax=Roseomonas marmotae TaxID=2768161 RepID=A0ABS3K9S1_9PROT|nr:DUF2239 family protein [Roseomonas marmotae]MBO1074214.1 DUF2239 family protein [Roseomonas marmotae]QTI78980.1 DUF2239 family protein [Roseomonas marmotae]